LEKDFKELENKLASALDECNSKDELLKKQTKIAQEAVAGNICACLCVFVYCSLYNLRQENK